MSPFRLFGHHESSSRSRRRKGQRFQGWQEGREGLGFAGRGDDSLNTGMFGKPALVTEGGWASTVCQGHVLCSCSEAAGFSGMSTGPGVRDSGAPLPPVQGVISLVWAQFSEVQMESGD